LGPGAARRPTGAGKSGAEATRPSGDRSKSRSIPERSTAAFGPVDGAVDRGLLRENLEHILEHGEPRVHEPAFEPDVDRYVTWDYGKGFVDGVLEAENETGSSLRDGWTSPTEAARCIRRALTTRGLTEDEVAEVLSEGGLPVNDQPD